ncbi:uncharacterized protein [Pocillopora verrucosa]|uniref:uncharacterized protein n=1 Tax=Pocillopora verrucosa TaxID=203993 RepID=UPI00334299CD
MSALVTLLVLLTIHSAETCDTFKPIKNYVLTGHVIKTIRDANFEKCTYRCELETKCFSINLYTKTSKCELNYGSKEMFPSDFKEELDALYIHNIRKDTGDPCNALYCLHGGSCHPFPQPNCMCPVGFVGSICQNITLSLEAIGIQDNNIIFDGELTSSTAAVGHEAWRGRLHGKGSWKPVLSDSDPRFEIGTFDPAMKISYIATQGSPDQDCWPTSFTLRYETAGQSKEYPQILAGNIDRNTVIYNPLKPALGNVSKLVIRPVSTNGCIGLRLELYK